MLNAGLQLLESSLEWRGVVHRLAFRCCRGFDSQPIKQLKQLRQSECFSNQGAMFGINPRTGDVLRLRSYSRRWFGLPLATLELRLAADSGPSNRRQTAPPTDASVIHGTSHSLGYTTYNTKCQRWQVSKFYAFDLSSWRCDERTQHVQRYLEICIQNNFILWQGRPTSVLLAMAVTICRGLRYHQSIKTHLYSAVCRERMRGVLITVAAPCTSCWDQYSISWGQFTAFSALWRTNHILGTMTRLLPLKAVSFSAAHYVEYTSNT